MIESIKNQIWDILKGKEISLAIIYDKDGKILWTKGRAIIGNSVNSGFGFSKTAIKKTLENPKLLKGDDVIVESLFGKDLSHSAKSIPVKSLAIIPINDFFFLYIDSGTKEGFNETDYSMFKVLGKMFSEEIAKIVVNEYGISGISKKAQSIREHIMKFSIEEEPVLLLGETGVGKSYIANLIHGYSGRLGKFEVVETTTLNESLFESTMFGHKKGSFTGALFDKKGVVQEADGGTLFFDEIADIPISFQSKLLRFIETKRYRVLGENSEREADVRIVAATNRKLERLMENKMFREDLYYRLHVLEIEIPPLRDRKEDIKSFVMENKKYLKGKSIGDDFYKALQDYSWPGNVRELINVLKRAGILLSGPITGDAINSIVYRKRNLNNVVVSENSKLQKIWMALRSGTDFWEAVKIPYLDRDLNRSEVKKIISMGLEETNGKYVQLTEIFNLKKNEYRQFMKFLYRNKLK